MNVETFVKQSFPFIKWLVNWYNKLETIALDKLAGDPAKVAILIVDMNQGTCYEGPMASPRICDIITPVTNLLQAAWAHGVRNLVLSQDAHTEGAIEFAQWGPHGLHGSEEAETVAAIQGLPFYEQIHCFEKNSISPSIDTGLDEWLDMHPEIATFIVVGNATDLSIYQLAMHLRLRANARQLGGLRVIVPANCVDTFDATAPIPHHGDFMHLVFLYSMMQNGVTVVEQIDF